MGAGLVPVRKKGKLPRKTHQASYDLEYGKDFLEIHQDALLPNENILIVDDVLATGGTAEAAYNLVSNCGASKISAVFLIELQELKGRERLERLGLPFISLIKY